jgi:hypothetical protein
VAAHSFQVMGEIGLDEPNPNRFIEFWLFRIPRRPIGWPSPKPIIHGKRRPRYVK